MSMAGEFNELRKVGVTVTSPRQKLLLQPLHHLSGESGPVEGDGGHDSKHQGLLNPGPASNQTAAWSPSIDDVILGLTVMSSAEQTHFLYLTVNKTFTLHVVRG